MSSSNDPSDWTRVVRKGRKNKRNNGESHSQAGSKEVKPREDNLQDPADLEKDYMDHRKRWEEDVQCSQVREIVKTQVAHLKNINKAVHFGVGTFDPNDGVNYDGKRSTFVQLAAFELMVEELKENITGREIETFFQDPAFTTSDKKFLENIGHTVVESPKGAELVDENTFFFGVHLYKPVYNDALKGELPVMFVGTSWHDWGDIFAAEDIDNVEKLHNAYERCEFPRDKYDVAFSTTSIYWKPKVEGEGKGRGKEAAIETAKKNREKNGESEEKKKNDDEEEELAKKLEATTIN
ncbi:hypothetical protein FBEOM_1981 [Fusarium beomiforme]|uniref:SRR1-like domain-containing protein n=1 Tax=Fusarium beomiforme TaxID=44412 RepID=A0A9P5ASP3_9HYPO|nr:hypothetical protein FBEOM_1981 [Fusarium beomiforme]